jgi:ribulose-bisphosphate carboxylase small chain
VGTTASQATPTHGPELNRSLSSRRFFETFSYLPPLTDSEISRQVDYLVQKGYTPCIEFEDAATAYVTRSSGIDSSAAAGYYDNRYWTMWKLPMFGATDGDQVLREIKMCKQKFPNSFVRLAGFDGNRQARNPLYLAPFSVIEGRDSWHILSPSYCRCPL